MARSKAKSSRTKSVNSNNLAENSGDSGGSAGPADSHPQNIQHHQQLNQDPVNMGPSTSRGGFGSAATESSASNPRVLLRQAEDVRVSENYRPMTEEEELAQQLKHLEPYQPEAEPATLIAFDQDNARVRMVFPKRNSNYDPYVRWNDFPSNGNGQAAAGTAGAEEEGEGSESSRTSSSSRGRGGGRGGGGGRKGSGVGRGGGAGGTSRNTPLHGTQGRLSYSLLGVAKENPTGRERQVIYGVAFNQWVGLSADVFATVGDNSVTVYQCHRDFKGGFRGLASYYAQGEIFYSCDWSRCTRNINSSTLVFAGDSGHIRTITFFPHGGQRQAVLGSHPHAVNDVRVDRKDPEICATGAADHSLRLWNVEKRILIAIFGGAEGPRNQVVSVSFHDHYPIVAGTGIDHTIHFWDLGSPDLVRNIAASKEYSMHQYTFKPVLQHMPKWVTRDIHSNFVDCIAFWGDWVITRSVNEDIILWRCGRDGEHLMELKYEIFNENLNVPPVVPPEWMQQPSPIPRRLTGLSQVADAAESYLADLPEREGRREGRKPPARKRRGRKGKKDGEGNEDDAQAEAAPEVVTTRATRSRSATALREEEVAPSQQSTASSSSSSTTTRKSASSKATVTTSANQDDERSKKPLTRRSTSASSASLTAAVSALSLNSSRDSSSTAARSTSGYVNDGQLPCGSKDHLRLDGLVTVVATAGDSQLSEPAAGGTSKGTAQKGSSTTSASGIGDKGAKSSKINIGPDVQICQKFQIKHSSSWFLRFGLDYEHKLLGFGNEVGDYSLFYLGQWKDQEALTGGENSAFRQVREMKIPVFPDIANCFVRQVAFNYTGQLMVGVTDRCHVALYRLAVADLPKSGVPGREGQGGGRGSDGVQRIFAKARAASLARAVALAAKSSFSSVAAVAATPSASSPSTSASTPSPMEVEVIELDDENSSSS